MRDKNCCNPFTGFANVKEPSFPASQMYLMKKMQMWILALSHHCCLSWTNPTVDKPTLLNPCAFYVYLCHDIVHVNENSILSFNTLIIFMCSFQINKK